MRCFVLVALVTGLVTANPPALHASGDSHDNNQQQCRALLLSMRSISLLVVFAAFKVGCCEFAQEAQLAVEVARSRKKVCANNHEALEMANSFTEQMSGIAEEASKRCDENPQGAAAKSCTARTE